MTHRPNRPSSLAAALAALAVLAAGFLTPAASEGQTRPRPPTLKSVSIELPDDAGLFTGPSGDLLNARCIACHSASMVLTQPPMTAMQWRATVVKMRDAYRAPVPEADVDAIAAALASLQEGTIGQN